MGQADKSVSPLTVTTCAGTHSDLGGNSYCAIDLLLLNFQALTTPPKIGLKNVEFQTNRRINTEEFQIPLR
jgi:hypothetical protein